MSDDNPPDRRKHGYKELEQQLNDHAAAIEARFRKRYRGMLIAFSMIGLTSAFALAGFGYLLDKHGKQQDNLEAQQEQLARLSAANRNLVFDIQEQRKNSIRENCEASNKRNADTSSTLRAAAEKAIQNAPDAATQERIRGSRDVSLSLIDSLAPKENCDDKVAAAVKPVDPVPIDPTEEP